MPGYSPREDGSPVRGQPVTTCGVQDMVKGLAKRAGITRRILPPLFRHTFASDMLEQGIDRFTLQALLGHSTLEMVRHYARISKAAVVKRYRRLRPVDALLMETKGRPTGLRRR